MPYLYWLILLSKPITHCTINMTLKGILSSERLTEMIFPFLSIELVTFIKQTEKTKNNHIG